ncbi:50S ribosomal protein L3 [Patescibacteria group bacterium]
MIASFFGTKLQTAQAFDDKGNRHVVTEVKLDPMTITQVKSEEKDGYFAYQLAIGQKSPKSLNKPLKKHLKGAKLDKAPRFLREVKLNDKPELKIGDQVKLVDVFKLNDAVKATGITKGRGFAGVIKRWGFHGGPRTHGQSDRQRAPGSIGQGTDPGRVWKGKKMPGHYGTDTFTVRGLQIIAIDEATNIITITGTIPGHNKSLVQITKTGKAKRPIKLFDKTDEVKKVKKVKSKKKDKPKPKK